MHLVFFLYYDDTPIGNHPKRYNLTKPFENQIIFNSISSIFFKHLRKSIALSIVINLT